MSVKKEVKTMKCQCNTHKGKNPLAISNFYSSNSILSVGGKTTICKKCIKEKINYNEIQTIYDMLMALDIPFIYDVWMTAENSKNDTFGKYISLIGSLSQYSSCTSYKQSVFEPSIKDKNSLRETIDKKNKFEIDGMTHEQLEDKFGIGYTDEEYYCFEKKWRKLIDNYGQKTSLHTEALTTYIRFRVKEELATANGDVTEATKWGGLAEKAQQAGKLNVSQLSKSDISGGVDVICQLFEAVESEVGIIPLLPKLIEQPQDDADMIIWSLINYGRVLEDKPMVQYQDIWNFYNNMLQEYCNDKGMSEKDKLNYLEKRNNTFKDLGKIYKEPLYEGDFEGNFEEEE